MSELEDIYPDARDDDGLPPDYLDDDHPAASSETRLADQGVDEDEKDSDSDDVLTSPLLAITGEDGKEVQLTGADVLDRISRVTDLENELNSLKEQLGKATGAAPAGRGQQTQQQDAATDGQEAMRLEEVGPTILAMLEGEKGGPEAVGPFMRYLVHTFSGEKSYQDTQVSKFMEEFPDFNEALDGPEVQAIRQENGLWKPLEAYLVAKARGARAENATLQARIAELEKVVSETKKTSHDAGRQAGKKEVAENLKAKGNIRLLTGGGGRAAGTSQNAQSKQDLSDPDVRSSAMFEGLMRLRGKA